MKEEKELLQKMVEPAVETEHQWIEKLYTVMVALATTTDESCHDGIVWLNSLQLELEKRYGVE